MAKKKERTEVRTCFLITPIGKPGTPVRTRVDQWVNLIYKPALKGLYTVVRADQIESPGYITQQILDLLVKADLAIIDYSGFNPNVMYEAAIRHAAEKPYIQILDHNDTPPFDIKDMRTIPYDPMKLDYYIILKKQIHSMAQEFITGTLKVPKLFKDQFDFGKISSNPEQFAESLVESLKKQLIPVIGNSGAHTKKIVQINDELFSVTDTPTWGNITPWASKSITCPNCGFTTTFGSGLEHLSLTTTLMGNRKHYKCENCGHEFFQ